MSRSVRIAALAVFGAALAVPAMAQIVKVTPLGGIDGEFCPQDRALVFEDPNGTRILYDPGRTVAGGGDPRLGKIDVILVSHMHGDHAGNAHNKAPNSGTCAAPDMSVSAMPNSNAANIAVAKKSKIVTGRTRVVDPSFDCEAVGCVVVEAERDARANRREGVEAFRARELDVLALELARGDVVDARQPEDVPMRVRLWHLRRARADHHADFRLVIDPPDPVGDHDGIAGPMTDVDGLMKIIGSAGSGLFCSAAWSL